MASCDTCRKPGACCRGFLLNRWFNAATWRTDAAAFCNEFGFSFVPVRALEGRAQEDGTLPVLFDCKLLDEDGRCTDYENRPQLCRVYEPGADALCAEYVPSLRGIPIVPA